MFSKSDGILVGGQAANEIVRHFEDTVFAAIPSVGPVKGKRIGEGLAGVALLYVAGRKKGGSAKGDAVKTVVKVLGAGLLARAIIGTALDMGGTTTTQSVLSQAVPGSVRRPAMLTPIPGDGTFAIQVDR